MSAHSDTRGFVYALEPLLQLKVWQCDRLGHKLARLQSDIVQAETEYNTAQQHYQACLRQLRDLSHGRFEPYWYRQQLDYLGQQYTVLERCRAMLTELQEQKRQLMQQYAQAQRKAESIVGHQSEQWQEHLQLVQQRQQNEADRQWAARCVWMT